MKISFTKNSETFCKKSTETVFPKNLFPNGLILYNFCLIYKLQRYSVLGKSRRSFRTLPKGSIEPFVEIVDSFRYVQYCMMYKFLANIQTFSHSMN